MISHLHEEFDPCVRQLIEHIARSDILCVVIVVIHHVAEMDHSPDVQFVSSIDQSPDRCVHDVSAVLHGVLGIRDQNDIVVVLISQLIALVASVFAEILFRIFYQPLTFVQTSGRDPYLLKAPLQELIQCLPTFVPPAGPDPEASVLRIRVQARHLIGDIVSERLASVYIGADLMSVGGHCNMVPHASLVHADGPCRRRHHMTVVPVGRNILNFLTVGYRREHGALLPF